MTVNKWSQNFQKTSKLAGQALALMTVQCAKTKPIRDCEQDVVTILEQLEDGLEKLHANKNAVQKFSTSNDIESNSRCLIQISEHLISLIYAAGGLQENNPLPTIQAAKTQAIRALALVHEFCSQIKATIAPKRKAKMQRGIKQYAKQAATQNQRDHNDPKLIKTITRRVIANAGLARDATIIFNSPFEKGLHTRPCSAIHKLCRLLYASNHKESKDISFTLNNPEEKPGTYTANINRESVVMNELLKICDGVGQNGSKLKITLTYDQTEAKNIDVQKFKEGILYWLHQNIQAIAMLDNNDTNEPNDLDSFNNYYSKLEEQAAEELARIIKQCKQ